MRKRIFIAAVLLLAGFAAPQMSVSPQTRQGFTRTALSKMDVLSRAALFEYAIEDAARKEGVDPHILWTIAYNETRFRPWLTSPKNAQGLMQFIPATARRFGLADPYQSNASIVAAARYVKYLGRLFDGNIESVLAAYNAGEGTVLAYLHGRMFTAGGKRINPTRQRTINGIPPYKETRHYVANGKKIYRWLRIQGKFDRIKRDERIGSTGPIVFEKQDFAGYPNGSEAVRVTVLYDPRTGKRYLFNSQSELSSIEQSGAVIVSPGVRGLPAQKARSTFTGIKP